MTTPTPGSVPYLGVLFENRATIRYKNPSNLICVSFGDCPDLPHAQMVTWFEVPLHKVAAFYETSDCTYRDGTVTINSGSQRDSVDGWHRFEPPHMIRSVMYGPNEAAVLQEKLKATKVTPSCQFTTSRAWFDSASIGANDTGINTMHEIEWSSGEGSAGGLLSNWTDVLPDESKTSGSSIYGDDDVGAAAPVATGSN